MTTAVEKVNSVEVSLIPGEKNPFNLPEMDGIASTPFGYFDIKGGEVVAFSDDGLVWEVANDKQLSFRLDEMDY